MITPLDLEHTDVLGATIGQIAVGEGGHHQAGRARFHRPSAARWPGRSFAEAARERGSPITFLIDVDGRVTTVELSTVTAHGCTWSFVDGACRRFPAFHARASSRRRTRRWRTSPCAACIPRSPSAQFRRGFLAARLPGRMELRASRPPHRPGRRAHAARRERLLESFRDIFLAGRPRRPCSSSAPWRGRTRWRWPRSSPRGSSRSWSPRPGTFKPSDPEEVRRDLPRFNPARCW